MSARTELTACSWVMYDYQSVASSGLKLRTNLLVPGLLIVFMALIACVLFASRKETVDRIFHREALHRETSPSAPKTTPATRIGSTEAPEQNGSFEARCNAVGVLVCQGFDSPDGYRPAKYPAVGLYPAWDGAIRGVRDTSVKASGAASLRFEVPSHSSANASGYWKQPMGKEFREGATFYVQFRQRFSKEMLKNNWGGTTWKQVIFHNETATCGAVELTTVQYYSAGFPSMYTNCGGRPLYTNNGQPPTKLEQGDYNCWYGRYNPKDCFYYPAEEWITFYYQISIGHWGKPDSTINAWVALDGKLYKQWIQMPNFVLDVDRPGEGFDTVTLLTYMTAKSELLDHPVAYTWYDDLVVSANPIVPPSISSEKEGSATTQH